MGLGEGELASTLDEWAYFDIILGIRKVAEMFYPLFVSFMMSMVMRANAHCFAHACCCPDELMTK
jgi:hypothetical protein